MERGSISWLEAAVILIVVVVGLALLGVIDL